MYDEDKKIAINKQDYSDEIFDDFGFNKEDFNFKEASSSEVGDIYSLGTKYAQALGLNYTDADGKEQVVYMGSYGIGISRVMGTIVEALSDDKGLVWPISVAPYHVHLLSLGHSQSVNNKSEDLHHHLSDAGFEFLYDYPSASNGIKWSDSTLIPMPIFLIMY